VRRVIIALVKDLGYPIPSLAFGVIADPMAMAAPDDESVFGSMRLVAETGSRSMRAGFQVGVAHEQAFPAEQGSNHLAVDSEQLFGRTLVLAGEPLPRFQDLPANPLIMLTEEPTESIEDVASDAISGGQVRGTVGESELPVGPIVGPDPEIVIQDIHGVIRISHRLDFYQLQRVNEIRINDRVSAICVLSRLATARLTACGWTPHPISPSGINCHFHLECIPAPTLSFKFIIHSWSIICTRKHRNLNTGSPVRESGFQCHPETDGRHRRPNT
jgi:hypothetical protein